MFLSKIISYSIFFPKSKIVPDNFFLYRSLVSIYFYFLLILKDDKKLSLLRYRSLTNVPEVNIPGFTTRSLKNVREIDIPGFTTRSRDKRSLDLDLTQEYSNFLSKAPTKKFLGLGDMAEYGRVIKAPQVTGTHEPNLF